eukprot:m.68006 g.68006  ORF g.68006 m.68006 type:complete len:355 (+) comp23902_c1_seq1:555-1619(+)
MFKDPERLTLAGSVSPLLNNLSVTCDNNTTYYAVASRCAVVIAEASRSEDTVVVEHKVPFGVVQEPNFTKSLVVLQVRWIRYHDVRLFVVTLIDGIEVFNSDYIQIYHYDILKDVVNIDDGYESNRETSFARGVCLVGNLLCVGCSAGEIIVFSLQMNGDAVTVVHKANLRGGHISPVSDIVTDVVTQSTDAVSADAAGGIVVWDMERLVPVLKTGGQLPMYILTSMASPCTSIAMSKGIVAIATFNGLITFFSVKKKEKLMEISAHARPINAIAIDPSRSLLVSVGEDCRLMVWHFPDLNNTSSKLLFSASIPNRLLYGVDFRKSDGAVVVSAFDSNQLIIFRPQTEEVLTRM